MAKKSETKKIDTSTEEKIKEAARTVFHKKGFAATRTRDIAEEADINLALLNYYFRSKAKLFEIIMVETLSMFINGMFTVLNDEKTSLEQKVELIASRYIDLLIKEPEIPIFIVSEMRNNPEGLLEKLPIREIILKSVLFEQHRDLVKAGIIAEPNPIHFLLNLLGLVIFPFLASPIIMASQNLKTQDFNALMQERKKLIPIWVKAMVQAK